MAVVFRDSATRPPSSGGKPGRKLQGGAGRLATLDPELDAQLRRQRAHEYGRAVRQSLAIWHERYSARRQEQLEALRQQWEEERASRLARLADKQLQQQLQQRQEVHMPGSAKPQFVSAAAASNSPAAPQPAARSRSRGLVPTAAVRLHSQHDPQCQQYPAASTAETPNPSAPPSHLGSLPGKQNVPRVQDASSPACTAQPNSPPDLLAALLGDLMAAEGPGDPLSIISLFIDEQLQLQQLQAQRQAKAAAARLRPRPAAAHQRAGACATTCPEGRAGCQPVGDEAPRSTLHPTASGAEQLEQRASSMQRQTSVGLDTENVPANVRHRRTSSLVALPLRFEAAGPVEHPVAWLPGGVFPPAAADAAANGSQAAQPAQQQPPCELAHGAHLLPSEPVVAAQEEQARPLQQADSIPLPQPDIHQLEGQSSSKQRYVHQWLQASAADLAGSGSPQSSAASYSADVHHEAADLKALSSSHRSVIQDDEAAAPACGVVSEQALPAAATEAVPGTFVFNSDLSRVSERSASSEASKQQHQAQSLPPGSSTQPSDTSGSHAGSVSGSMSRVLEHRSGLEKAAQAAVLHAVMEADAQTAPANTGLPADGLVHTAVGSSQPSELSGDENARQESTHHLDAVVLSSSSSSSSDSSSCVSAPLADMVSGAASPAADDTSASEPAGSERFAAVSNLADTAPGQEAEQAAASQADHSPMGSTTDPAYSTDSDFDSQVEIEFGELESAEQHHSLQAPAQPASEPLPAAAALGVDRQSAAAGAALVSPRALPAPPPQQAQRPRSPLHALDDRYPGSPPASPGRPPRNTAAVRQGLDPGSSSRPVTPLSQPGSRRESGDGGSRPGSPALGLAATPGGHLVLAAEAELPVLPAGGSRTASSPCSSQDTSGATSAHRDSGSGSGSGSAQDSPYALHRFSTDPGDEHGLNAAEAATDADGSLEAAAAAMAADQAAQTGVHPDRPRSGGPAAAAGLGAVDGSPPGTPETVPAPDPDAASCPGSARVEDSTVVQTEEHVHSYLGEVLAYFWQQRSEAFAAGQMPPLELEGYLAIERQRPACGDPQHIFNKLLFDAANEALAAHYSQALDSYTGRLDPRLALLSRELVEQNVAHRVLRWAGLGRGDSCSAEAHMSAILAEDAAEEERLLVQMASAVQADLAAAAAVEPQPTAKVGDQAGEEGQSDKGHTQCIRQA